MKFTEEKLEQSFIELLANEKFPHYSGDSIKRNSYEVLIDEDLQTFLKNAESNANLSRNYGTSFKASKHFTQISLQLNRRHFRKLLKTSGRSFLRREKL